MPAFRFRLESVLEWYRRQCEIEKERLAACLTVLKGARDSLACLEAERTAIERDILSRASLPATDLVALGLYRLRARARHLELTEEIHRREFAAAEQTAKYAAAERRQKLVEQLRERRRLEYVYAEDRELEKLAGEAYLGRWNRAR
jgi:flagellar export protein FliJ